MRRAQCTQASLGKRWCQSPMDQGPELWGGDNLGAPAREHETALGSCSQLGTGALAASPPNLPHTPTLRDASCPPWDQARGCKEQLARRPLGWGAVLGPTPLPGV